MTPDEMTPEDCHRIEQIQLEVAQKWCPDGEEEIRGMIPYCSRCVEQAKIQYDRGVLQRRVEELLEYVQHEYDCDSNRVSGWDPEHGYIIGWKDNQPVYSKEIPKCTCGLQDVLNRGESK